MYSRDELFLRSVECYFVFISHKNKHKNNPLVSAETVRHYSTYIILCFSASEHNQIGNKIWNDITDELLKSCIGPKHVY